MQNLAISSAVPLDNFYAFNSLKFTAIVAMTDEEADYYNLPGKGWYNVISFCGVDNRVSQIAMQCFGDYGGSKACDSYVRVKHDNTWYPWRKITMQ